MPNLHAHISLALRLAERLEEPLLERCRGAFLLGATAPDLRAMTRDSRDDTHFVSLDSTGLDDGVKGMYTAHPGLARACELPEATRAFLLGYISHLVADQAWVVSVYRPFFADPGLFPSRAEAKVLDRALQMEMDRRSSAEVEALLPALREAEVGVDVGFIDGQTLRAWRERVEGRLSGGFEWERLRAMARRRQEPEDLPAAERAAERFLGSVPSALAGLEAMVPWRHVEGFQAATISEAQRLSRRALTCA